MKKVIALFLFFASFGCAFAQDLPNLKNIKLNRNVHYKDTEPLALKVVNYLFETPVDKKNKARNEAGQFLIKWMNGTPEYVFYLEEKETNYFSTDADLMLMYMAGLTKFTLEHKSIKDQKTLALGALSLVLPYLGKQDDKKNWSAELWQLNEANEKGKLEMFLYPQ